MAKKQELKLNKLGCTNCGAEVLFDPGTQVLNCNFCGSSFEVEEAVEEKVIIPEGILPFSIKKEIYTEKVLEWLSEGDYTPDDILDGSQFGDVNGVYLPMWLYTGRYSGNWSASSGYNRTEYYIAYNSTTKKNERRSRVVTDWRPSNGQVQGNFSILCYAGTTEKIKPEIAMYAHGTGFKRGEMKDFNIKYTQGFNMVEYEFDDLDSWDKYGESQGSALVQSDAKNRIPGDKYKDFICDVMYDKKPAQRVYVPFWITYYSYGNKQFHVHMDGTTTSRIDGVRPVDEERKKAANKKFLKGHIGCGITTLLFLFTAFGIDSYDSDYDTMMEVTVYLTIITLILYGIGWYQKNQLIKKSKTARQELLKKAKEKL